MSIIGGGPAGAVTGLLLARAGVRTLIVEQRRFPRDKVCGECLSATGIQILRQLDLADDIRMSLCPTILRRTLLHPCQGDSLELPLPRPMWGLSRRELDNHLLGAAARAGVQVRQPARCEAIEPGERSVAATIRELSTGRVEQIVSETLILADGKAALLPERPRATVDLGIKSHWRGVAGPPDAIELFGIDGHYGGIAPIGGGEWNVSFSVPAAVVQRFGGELDAMFDSFMDQSTVLRDRLRSALRCGPWHAAPLPRFAVARIWPTNVIPVGNAAAAIEPIGGEGMGMAMRSAQLAAEAMLSADRAGTPIDTAALRRQYRAIWDWRRIACRALARVLSNPPVAAAAVALADASPLLSRVAMNLIGK